MSASLLEGSRWRRLIPLAVACGALGCTEGAPAVPRARDLPAALPSTEHAAVRIAPTRGLRRLSSREYDNVVRDLLGDASRPANRFDVHDAFPNGYDNGAAALAVQSEQVAAYETAAEALAGDAVRNDMIRLIGACNVPAQGESACADAFLASFAPRAFRRPLTASERDRLRGVFDAETSAGAGFAAGIQAMLEVVLQSPQFLYREELGPDAAVASSGAAVVLTDYEVATELSFLFTGSIPDTELWSAVQEGRFVSTKDYRREAARLLKTPGAKAALRLFLHEWLGTNRLGALTKDKAFYPTFDPAMATSMSAELDQFFDDVLWKGTGSLRELFTSNRSFADATLAAVYGATVSGPGFQPVTLDAALRKGILTRAGYLAEHANVDSSGPIARGVFLLQAIMCSPPAPPPANVPAAPPPTDPAVKNLTTRQRFEKVHLSSPSCASCHDRIDGLGFGFERFDGVGAYRDTESGQPVDSTGTITGTGEIDGKYDGVAELTVRLSGSRVLSDCYARQAYRYAMGRIEDSGDEVSWLTTTTSADSRMTDVLLAIVANPVFVNRSFE